MLPEFPQTGDTIKIINALGIYTGTVTSIVKCNLSSLDYKYFGYVYLNNINISFCLGRNNKDSQLNFIILNKIYDVVEEPIIAIF
jgi:ubiquitin C-terminal hydrolase